MIPSISLYFKLLRKLSLLLIINVYPNHELHNVVSSSFLLLPRSSKLLITNIKFYVISLLSTFCYAPLYWTTMSNKKHSFNFDVHQIRKNTASIFVNGCAKLRNYMMKIHSFRDAAKCSFTSVPTTNRKRGGGLRPYQ